MPEQTRCQFEKALISRLAPCHQAEQFMVGERVGFKCLAPAAAQRCERYLLQLRQNTRFVFHQSPRANSLLSNKQETCLQCGGLLGLAAMLSEASDGPGFDICRLLETVESLYPEMESIKLERIIPHIAAYDPRPHRKKKNRQD